MDRPDMPIEFKSDISDSDIDFYVMIEDRLREMAEGHTDITGAAATLEQPAEGRETAHVFEASIVIYVRPNDISATEKDSNPELAMKGALDAAERQLREQRQRLRDKRRTQNEL